LLIPGKNIVLDDELVMVPYLTGNSRLDWKFLWSQHNEHRILLPRLVMLGCYQIGGNDFRTGTYLNLLLLAILALAFICQMRRLTGAVSYQDAFFPLVILTLGQFECLLSGFQIQFVLSTFLAGVMLLVITWCRGRLSWYASGLFACCLVGLPLCGAQGLLLAGPLSLWLGYAGLQRCWEGNLRGRCHGLFMLLGVLGVWIVGIAYVIDFVPTEQPAPWDALRVGRAALQFVALSFGQAGSRSWLGVALLAICLSLAGGAAAAWTALKQPAERLRAVGMLLFLAAVTSLALGVSWGRVHVSDDYLARTNRYATLGLPGLCCLYLLWRLYMPTRTATVALSILCSLVVYLAPINCRDAIRFARYQHRRKSSLERDMLAGLPLRVVAERCAQAAGWGTADRFYEPLPMLARAGIAPFSGIDLDSTVGEIAVSLGSLTSHQIDWDGRSGAAMGADSHLTVNFDEPQSLYAVRLRYLVTTRDGTKGRTKVNWDSADRQAADAAEWFRPVSGHDVQHTFVVNDLVDTVRIFPNLRPCTFTISQLVLLVRGSGGVEAELAPDQFAQAPIRGSRE
jgi:hypothetical protein